MYGKFYNLYLRDFLILEYFVGVLKLKFLSVINFDFVFGINVLYVDF